MLDDELPATRNRRHALDGRATHSRFLHLADREDYGKLPARQRMNVIANPGTW